MSDLCTSYRAARPLPDDTKFSLRLDIEASERRRRNLLCYNSAMKQISERDLRNQSKEIMRALEDGESFVVTRSGAPLGKLIPLRRRNARLETVLQIFRSAPRIDYKRLRRDLDAFADAGTRPRG